MPADGLTLAVLVGGEIQLARILQSRAQVLDDLLATFGELVGGLESVVDVDGQALARQVGHMTHRGAHIEGCAEELGDRLGLRRRLHYHEGF